MSLLDLSVPGLPLGFAEQVMDLQMKLQQQQSLQLIQILTQMYKIAVDFYIDNDIKKAAYFQRKLNYLALKAITASSVQQNSLSKKLSKLPQKINQQIDKYKQCESTYLKSLADHNQKQQIKIRRHVEEGLQKQEDDLEGRRMLRRVRSQEKIKIQHKK